ncbi:MAG TPA: MG2 domain-containing protein [Vicinamibacterales bacterium]|nr:MG2 domain-containing protein [Vicinamibacterales bacterium]
MRYYAARLVAVVCLLAAGSAAFAQSSVTVVSAGPTGEMAQLDQVNEIRIVFSEPMVELGKIPQPVRVPFVRIRPAIAGEYRWSGTTVLIFTPDRSKPLPYATKFEVTVDAGTAAVSGRKLAAPYRFSFTTPTVKLLETHWYRLKERVGEPIMVVLRFNQRVQPADVLKHVTLAYEPHQFIPPTLTAAARERMKTADPSSLERFDAKVAMAASAAKATMTVAGALAADWDKKRFPAAPDRVVLQAPSMPPDSWLRVTVRPDIPSPAGPGMPGVDQTFTIKLERTFFIEGFDCASGCDPERWNPARLRADVAADAWRKAVTVIDVTEPKRERPLPRSSKPARRHPNDQVSWLTLEDAGFDRQPPARTFLVRVDGTLQSADGQTLGHNWIGVIENWHQRAFTSFGDGHGVWETSGGLLLPFYSRNFRNVTQWAVPLVTSELMPKVLELQEANFRGTPPGPGERRPLPVKADTIQSHGLNLKPALTAAGTGLIWAGVREGDAIPRATVHTESRERSTIVQVTNLGINVKDSPENTLVFVTRLDTGAPVAGANVSIVTTDNATFWKGTTGPDGLVLAPRTPLRSPREWWKFSFVVLAEKDGDVAYSASDWNEGISPWDFGHSFSLYEASPVLRGTVFTDRGVYRLGEEVHVKAILRSDTPAGIKLIPNGTAIHISVRDSRDKEIDKRTISMNAWSSAEWQMTLPADGALGNYSIVASAGEQKEPADEDERNEMRWDPARTQERVYGNFLVAAYRRPDFRVDTTVTGGSAIAGTTLEGVVTARYLFGAAMTGRPVTWKFFRVPDAGVTEQVRDRFPGDRFTFGECCVWSRTDPEQVAGAEAELNARGEIAVTLPTPPDAGRAYRYTLDGDVEDVSRQHIANRASIIVHPAPWYIGLKRVDYFIEQKRGADTEIVAVTPDGRVAPGVPVKVTLTQIQWNSVRRAEGNGFYTWETHRNEVKRGTWTITTAEEPIPLSIPLESGGSFVLTATASDEQGRHTTTSQTFYVLGEGYTAWQRYDHNRIELVADRPRYKPGDTARIMIQSPWEQATAVVTTEREGIRSHRQFALTSTQQSITVPVTEADIPNVYVSVLLVKGRTVADPVSADDPKPEVGKRYSESGVQDAVVQDSSDPGKPSFRLGYVELLVEDASKRLTVNVKSNRAEYRPAGMAKVDLEVKDVVGKPASSELTLWAVDYGVLSLTAFRTPDVLGSVYVKKALQVLNTDNRQRIISRRVLTPKGTDEGGGGGDDGGAGVRKDFRVLAFWLGSVTTDANGRASVDVKLPESLTTYRIMAVGGDRASRFGSGESEIRINKPVLLRPTFPRFLAVGDRVHFGSVVTSQLSDAGTAVVTVKSLDPGILEFRGGDRQDLRIDAKGQSEVRFEAIAKTVGRARVSMSVRLNSETDAFEDAIPVEILSSRETVAAYGEASTATATEKLTVPEGVVPGVGGLHVELSSTAMVGLGEGARYLVEYPYGCAEQRSSRTLALLLAADLGDAFALPGIDPAKLRPAVQTSIVDLEKYQCPSGAFAYWPGGCHGDLSYLTSYVLHVMQSAKTLKYDVKEDVISRAASYLEESLAQEPPTNEAWMPSFTAWEAFAVKVLDDVGRPQDSHVNRLYSYRDRMPIFGLAHLHDAIASKNASDPRVEELRRRMTNAILPEGGSAHVEELDDPYLCWLWSTNVRSTAIVLDSLVRRGGAEPLIRSIVRWMMNARQNGRWGNTQENAWAMQGLVNYYRRFESEIPDFTALVKVGEMELARDTFKGRSAEAVTRDLRMLELVAKVGAGGSKPLTFSKQGTGTLFYVARLQYASDRVFHDSLDKGFAIARRYTPVTVAQGFSPANDADGVPGTTFKAGDLIKVTLTLEIPKERRWVALVDPIPSGFEPVESWFQTTAADLAKKQRDEDEGSSREWRSWWERGGFDHVERHDDRVMLFATRLAEGRHEFSYIVRATTAGTFKTAPAHVEEMYEPEVFGRTSTVIVEVRR